MTKQQEMVQAICDVCGWDWRELPRSAFGSIGKVAAELIEVNATPEDVHRRAEVYSQKFTFGHSKAVLTPTALLKHWAGLKPEIKQSNETEFERAQRLAKEQGKESFKGAPYETPEQFIARVNQSNVVNFK